MNVILDVGTSPECPGIPLQHKPHKLRKTLRDPPPALDLPHEDTTVSRALPHAIKVVFIRADPPVREERQPYEPARRIIIVHRVRPLGHRPHAHPAVIDTGGPRRAVMSTE